MFPVFYFSPAPPSGQLGRLQPGNYLVQAGLQFRAKLIDFTDDAGLLLRAQGGKLKAGDLGLCGIQIFDRPLDDFQFRRRLVNPALFAELVEKPYVPPWLLFGKARQIANLLMW